MAAILERLEAIAELMSALPDPGATCASMLHCVEQGDVHGLTTAVPDSELARSALTYGGIIDERGQALPGARDQLLRLEGMLKARAADERQWQPVMTVPPFLRRTLPTGSVSETLPALIDLISTTRRRLVLAAPFLDPGVESLIPAIARLVRSGSTVLVITRELAQPGSHNFNVVRRLRERSPNDARLVVVSWEEEGLGLHMKTVVSDSSRAYVGSANLTWGGLGTHAELGVLLEGPAVGALERLLDALALELRERRRLRSR